MSIYSPNRSKHSRSRLFIIEDNDDHWYFIQQAIEQVLPELTYVRASNSLEALALLKGWGDQEWELPKLILLDLYLPKNSDGWHLIRQIKAMATPISLVPIVLLSASVDKTDIDESYAAGATSYVAKPIDLTDWLLIFRQLRLYWWETVTLPPVHFFK